MKKQLIAAAIASAFALPAMAQNVTLSGTIQAGVINDGQVSDSRAGVASLGGGMNAININATEDLGGGLRAGATFQLRFNAATGDTNSNGVAHTQTTAAADIPTTFPHAPVYHAANVFLSSDNMGTFRLGKVAEDSNCGFDPWACGGGAAMMAGIGATSSASSLTALRRSLLVGAGSMANSIYYQTPSIQGIRISYQASLSQVAAVTSPATAAQTAGPGDANRENERRILNLTYTSGPISAQYISVRGGQNSGAARTDDLQKEVGFGLAYDFGFARVSAYKTDKESQAGLKTAEITSFGASIPRGAYTFLAGYSTDNAAGSGRTGAAAATADQKWSLGVNYALSKRTTVGADVFQADIANGSTGYVVRARHTF